MILPGSRTVPPPTLSTCNTSSATGQRLDAPKVSGAQGSEDMIIPNSEDESEDDNSNDSGASQGPVSLDLKQFSFTASGTTD